MENENDRDIVEAPELRRSKRPGKVKSFVSDLFIFFVVGNRESVIRQIPYCFNTEAYTQTFEEAMKDRDATFWKETLNNEIDSLTSNNTWELVDLPPGCKPIKCQIL